MHAFDNVFVDRAAYAAFQKTGTLAGQGACSCWRSAAAEAARLDQQGAAGSRRSRMAVEVHVKDTARFKGGWALLRLQRRGAGAR